MSAKSVRLELPALSAYLVLARTSVTAMCARMDFPLDRLDDVKLAVDEACTLLLADMSPDESINIKITPGDRGHLMIEIRANTIHGRPPKQTSFAWAVLTALVDQATTGASHGKVFITLHANSGIAAAAS